MKYAESIADLVGNTPLLEFGKPEKKCHHRDAGKPGEDHRHDSSGFR